LLKDFQYNFGGLNIIIDFNINKLFDNIMIACIMKSTAKSKYNSYISKVLSIFYIFIQNFELYEHRNVVEGTIRCLLMAWLN
jgi:retron-type reverse transcriptase